MNPINRILGKRIAYDSSYNRTIIYIPINKAYNMRKKWAGVAGMEPKREPYTMARIEQGILQGNFEPITATSKELAEGVLSEGKHRILIAKKLGMRTVPIEVVD
jgi:hypothetical protein